MSEEEKNATENDILYEIDMQLYNEFNDKIAGMYDHIGDIYSLRDVEEVEKAQKDKEVYLLRMAVAKLQKEIKELENRIDLGLDFRNEEIDKYMQENYISKDKIREKIEEKEKQKEKVPHEMNFKAFYRISDLKEVEIGVLKELLGE